MRTLLLVLFLIATEGRLVSQDSLKVLDHTDFLTWKTIQDQKIASNGSFVTYRLVPGEGDPVLHIYSKSDSTTMTVDRVSKYDIDYNGQYVFGIVTPHRDSLRMQERKKVDKKKWPSDTLFIYDVRAKQFHRIPYVTGYKAPAKHGGWLAYTLKKEAFPVDTTVKEKKGTG